MSSSSKRRQTMAKMTRERAVKEKRARKAEKKEERKAAAAEAAAAELAGTLEDPEPAEGFDDEAPEAEPGLHPARSE